MESFEESGDLLSPTCSTCQFTKLYYNVIKEIQNTRKIPMPVSPGERRDFLYSVIMRMIGNIYDLIEKNTGKEYSIETIKVITEAMWSINEQLLKNKSINLNTKELTEEIGSIANLIKTEVLSKNG